MAYPDTHTKKKLDIRGVLCHLEIREASGWLQAAEDTLSKLLGGDRVLAEVEHRFYQL